MKGIEVMKEYIGCDEHKDNMRLRSFFLEQSIKNDIKIDPAITPWCSAMLNACERQVGNKGTGKLNARSWLDYGTIIKTEDAEEGDICIWDFEHDGARGHVTYFVQILESGKYITCLGGNQDNQVKESNYDVINLLGIRRPPK